jgi:hypothetical protein
MDDYFKWLTAGLIFLWILGAYDARAAGMDPGGVECGSTGQCASRQVPFPRDQRARTEFVRREAARWSGSATRVRITASSTAERCSV